MATSTLKAMEIENSRLWSKPLIVLALLKNIFVLDPTVLFGNPRVYSLKQDNKIVSFVVVKPYRNVHELKSVYTFPRYRGKHSMSHLLKAVTKEYLELVLICKPRLQSFYSRFGFKKTHSGPAFLRFEQRFANLFIFQKKSHLILMCRVTPQH